MELDIKTGLLTALLLLGQNQLHDAGPVKSGDPNVRHAVLPGTLDKKLRPIEGFSCRTFTGYTEMQTFMNLLQGDMSCSGEVLDRGSGSFRQVNFLPTGAGRLAVVIHSPRDRVDDKSRIVIFMTGGPRNIAVTRPLTKRLLTAGYTVLMPIYLGELETRHPHADLPGAVKQVGALSRWAGTRLVATIGVSTGAYLAAASCARNCGPRVLLAPPLTTPEDILSDKRVDWSKLHSGFCLWRQNGPMRICADDRPFIRSFWGDRYYRRSLADMLRRRCERVTIVVSPDDERVYDPVGVTDLRRIGCTVDTPVGYEHWQVDADETINEHTIKLIKQSEKLSSNRQKLEQPSMDTVKDGTRAIAAQDK